MKIAILECYYENNEEHKDFVVENTIELYGAESIDFYEEIKTYVEEFFIGKTGVWSVIVRIDIDYSVYNVFGEPSEWEGSVKSIQVLDHEEHGFW